MTWFRYLPLALGLVALAASSAEPPTSEAIHQEATRRHQALIQEGYHLTYGWSLGSLAGKGDIQLPLLVPENDADHQFQVWFETPEGEVSIRLIDEQGNALMATTGRQGEVHLSRRMPTGKYTFQIHTSAAKGGRAELGVKGPLILTCALDPARFHEFSAAPSQGFHWPYLLFKPTTLRHATLLVVPNNTGFAVERLEFLRANGVCELQGMSELANRLGCPVLVPLFPRPATDGEARNLYLHALSLASMKTEVPAWKRVDLQLLAMIRHAQAGLKDAGQKMDSKVLLWGFSASGQFVSRFTLLHPEAVLGVSCGSPGGWPMAPVPEVDGEALNYPLGTADLQKFSGGPLRIEALKQVRWFFFLGDQDENDAVPFRDAFSKADEELVRRRFGANLPARWRAAERLYAGLGLQAQFVLYPGVAHVVTPGIQEDIARFFEKCLTGLSKTH